MLSTFNRLDDGWLIASAVLEAVSFSSSQLVSANFRGVVTKSQTLSKVILALFTFVASAMFTFPPIVGAVTFSSYVASNMSISSERIVYVFAYSIIAVVVVAIVKHGYTLISLGYIAVLGVLAVALSLIALVLDAGSISKLTEFTIAVSLASAVGLSLAISASGISTASVTRNVLPAVFGVIFSMVLGNYLNLNTHFFSYILSVVFCCLSLYAMKRVQCGDKNYPNTIRVGNKLLSIGSVSFRKSNLSGASFSNSNLSGSDFRFANIRNASFLNAEGLDRALLDGTILYDDDVRDLMVSGMGRGKNFRNKDFKGANLSDMDLVGADFSGADLSSANLKGADLTSANLTQCQLLGADLDAAILTGSCLESWNIDHLTNLNNAQADYIYLLNESGERRPSSGTFQPGEFSALFVELINTIDFIFQNGVDWKVFIDSFKRLQLENPNEEISMQSIENKGNSVVIKVGVSDDIDKSLAHESFLKNYEAAAFLFKSQSKHISFLEGVVKELASRSVNVSNHLESYLENKSMSGDDNSVSFNNSGSITESNLAIGNISGTVSTSISQLKSLNNPSATELARLLGNLKVAIESDMNLPSDEKVEALTHVAKLAEAGVNPQDSGIKKAAKDAFKLLQGTLTLVPDAVTFGEACSKILPVVSKLVFAI